MNEKREITFNEKVLETVWAIMEDVLRSVASGPCDLTNYAVKMDFLKYPNSSGELDGMFSLLGDSSGYWTRVGMGLDRDKAKAIGPFNMKGIRDIFALGNLIPGIKNVLEFINLSCLPYSKARVDSEDAMIIGEPHIDSPNILTCLISQRDVLRTEVYDNGRWWELPLSSDALAFFPSGEIGQISQSLPTYHRVLLLKNNRLQGGGKPNITLNLSIIPWSQNQ